MKTKCPFFRVIINFLSSTVLLIKKKISFRRLKYQNMRWISKKISFLQQSRKHGTGHHYYWKNANFYCMTLDTVLLWASEFTSNLCIFICFYIFFTSEPQSKVKTFRRGISQKIISTSSSREFLEFSRDFRHTISVNGLVWRMQNIR